MLLQFASTHQAYLVDYALVVSGIRYFFSCITLIKGILFAYRGRWLHV